MDNPKDDMEISDQLQELIEQLYAWLCSGPEILFNARDAEQMQRPVAYFHEAINWLARTTLANAEWFFKEGSQIVMNRWLKDDYNAYE